MFNCYKKRLFKRWMYLVWVPLFLPVLLLAQQYNLRSWTLEHGLPQSYITDIIQDTKGQLWLATTGGVSQFNGTAFNTYTSHAGLPGNNIKCLFQDSRQRIWIGTYADGLGLYNGASEFVSYTPSSGLPAGTIHDIAEDKLGRLWFATDSGVIYFNNTTFTKSKDFPVQAYTSILCGSSGEVWAGSATQGLYVLRNNSTTHYTYKNGLPGNNINCIQKDRTGRIWIGTDKGVSYFQQQKLHVLALSPSVPVHDVVAFAQDNFDNIWVGLRSCGLLKYDGRSFTHITKKNGLRSNRITSLAADSEGNIWIGTAGYGLHQYKSPWFTHYFEFDNLKEPKITALAKDAKGNIWLGTDDGHIGYNDNGIFKWIEKEKWPEGTAINYIYINKNQEKWLCTSNGIWKLTQGRPIHYSIKDGLPSNEIYYCVSDEKGNLWFATAQGIAQLEKGKFNLLPGQHTGKVYTLKVDKHKQLWVGAEKGIFKLEKNVILKESALNSFKPREIATIAEDSLGNMYFGGSSHGLLVLDATKKVGRYYTTQQGLPQADIQSLYIDYRDNLWIGTSKSVIKAPLQPLRQQHKLELRTYSYQDGFRGIEVGRNTIVQTTDSTIWFGTAKGLTLYNQNLDSPNKVHPKIILDGIQLFMQATNWGKMGYKVDTTSGLPVNLQLPYHQNHLTFNFNGICMTLPEKVMYKYRLRGYTDAWSVETKQPFITFANLDPGSYTFELLARNNDGYWSPTPLTYTFQIEPPLWRQMWFLALLLLLLSFAVISLVRLREKNLVKQNLLLEQKVRHRTQLLEEKNREKETLLKEVHHRVKNNLQIVISLLNLQARHTTSQEAVDVMRAIRNRVRSMAILHERLYQQSDLGKLDLNTYFTQICESLYSSFGASCDRIALEIDVPHVKIDIDSAITLGLIVNELVSNALKYAFPNEQAGFIRIVLKDYGDHNYSLTISDNGAGLPQDAASQNSSFGLQLVSSLIRKLNGKIDLKTSHGTIATLTFVLPS